MVIADGSMSDQFAGKKLLALPHSQICSTQTITVQWYFPKAIRHRLAGELAIYCGTLFHCPSS